MFRSLIQLLAFAGSLSLCDAQSNAVFSQDLENSAIQTYASNNTWKGDWWSKWDKGVSDGRAKVIEENGNHILEVFLPENSVTNDDRDNNSPPTVAGGVAWRTRFDSNSNVHSWTRDKKPRYDELYLSYRLKFSDGYDFARGGKLPGLAGGYTTTNTNGTETIDDDTIATDRPPTGGKKPTGYDGFSARMMWHAGGTYETDESRSVARLVQYVYQPDPSDQTDGYQPSSGSATDPYGTLFYYADKSDANELLTIESGKWYHITHRVKMNTIDDDNTAHYDGVLEAWVDGVNVVSVHNLRFRYINDFSIDTLLFTVFHGGSDNSWANNQDQYIYFDDIVLSEYGDSDGDGFSDADEILAGTDRFDPDDFLKTSTPVAVYENGQLAGHQISWPTKHNKLYSLYWSTDLINFQLLAENLSPDQAEFTNTQHLDEEKIFYRLAVEDDE